MLYNYLLEEQERLLRKMQSVENQIKTLPTGTLDCVNSGKYVSWFRYDEKQKQTHYIKKKDRALAEQLAAKKYLKELKKELQQENEAIEMYIQKSGKNSNQSEHLLEDDSLYKELLISHFKTYSQQIENWINEPFEQSKEYPEQLKIHTRSGNIVRSKSESIIDSALLQKHIPFRYECKLDLGECFYYPDFTILNQKMNQIMYWEHLGKMDDSKYVIKNIAKIQNYILHGIIPGINLIISTETENTPLSPDMVDKLVECYLN